MDMVIDYTSVKVKGYINLHFKNQDDVDEFNENNRLILDEFCVKNNMLAPEDRMLRIAPIIMAGEDNTFEVSSHYDEGMAATGLRFPFMVKVMSNDYTNVQGHQR